MSNIYELENIFSGSIGFKRVTIMELVSEKYLNKTT